MSGRGKRLGGTGVEEASRPQWIIDLDTDEERSRVRKLEVVERRRNSQRAREAIKEKRTFMSDRASTARSCWPVLAPLRVDLLSLSVSSATDEFGEPEFVDAVFRVEVNDPSRSRFRLSTRVSAVDASTPGVFAEGNESPRSPDYLSKAWYSLARFGRMLSEVANVSFEDDSGVNTPLTRWLTPMECAEEMELFRSGGGGLAPR